MKNLFIFNDRDLKILQRCVSTEANAPSNEDNTPLFALLEKIKQPDIITSTKQLNKIQKLLKKQCPL